MFVLGFCSFFGHYSSSSSISMVNFRFHLLSLSRAYYSLIPSRNPFYLCFSLSCGLPIRHAFLPCSSLDDRFFKCKATQDKLNFELILIHPTYHSQWWAVFYVLFFNLVVDVCESLDQEQHNCTRSLSLYTVCIFAQQQTPFLTM